MKLMNAVILSLVTVSALALSGCGRDKANAIKAYSDIQLVAAHGQENANQEYANLIYRITPIKTSEGNNIPRFYEGDAGEAKFQLDILDTQVTKAELALANLPAEAQGATFSPSSNEKNVWVFRWTPKQGTLNGASYRDFDLQVAARPLEVSNYKAEGFTKVISQPIIVLPSKIGPKITSKNIPGSVDEGTSTPFTISIKDPAGHGAAPVLEVVRYSGTSNAENMKFDALPYLTTTQVSGPDANGIYTHGFVLETNGKLLPQTKETNADGVNVCFTARVVSRTTANKSDDESFCTRIMFAAQPPVPLWSSDPERAKDAEQVTAKKAETISFSVKTLNDKGNVLVLDTAKKFLAGLPSEKDGNAVMECGDQTVEASTRTCTITWTPSCKAAGKSFELNLAMKAVLGKTSKSRTEKRKLTVAPNPEACDVKGSI